MPDEAAAPAGAHRAAELVAGAERIVVLTGAGISTDSGIPDFRGPEGVWTKDPAAERMSHIDHYVADGELRQRAWAMRVERAVPTFEPNAGHRALVRLEATGRLLALITQNIDGLHHVAGSDPDRVIEVHGSSRDVVCLDCDYRAPMVDALDRVRAGEVDPACPECGGILKSGTVSFGQNLDPDDLRRCDVAAREADLLLAVGTTLGVYPVANVVPIAKASGAAVVIVNGSPTEMDDLADVVVRGSISEILDVVIP